MFGDPAIRSEEGFCFTTAPICFVLKRISCLKAEQSARAEIHDRANMADYTTMGEHFVNATDFPDETLRGITHIGLHRNVAKCHGNRIASAARRNGGEGELDVCNHNDVAVVQVGLIDPASVHACPVCAAKVSDLEALKVTRDDGMLAGDFG